MSGARLRSILVVLALSTSVMAAGCATESSDGGSADGDEAAEAGEDALIGGAPARVDQFPARCT